MSFTDFEGLRSRFGVAVRANQIVVDPLWEKPCLGYNAFIPLERSAQESLRFVQEELLRCEPDSLAACPSDTLHVTAAWILGTPQTYSRSKEEIWQEIQAGCLTGLAQVCAATPVFTIRYREVIATDTAVIAVAVDDGSLQALREAISASLPIPAETRNQNRIIHSTLFRYRAPLRDSERFLSVLRALSLDTAATVTELTIWKETVYPCLHVETQCVAPLQGV